MLRHISIRNFVIVDHLELDFRPGMTALTGETGAGKSILIGALGLVLGNRADAKIVRAGADKTDISAEFDPTPAVARWLNEQELDDSECLLRRVISSEGRSRAFVNGTPVAITALRDLAERLVEIHGQHAHQQLMKPDRQRQMLDAFVSDQTLIEKTRACYKQWQQAQKAITELAGSSTDREQRLELLRYQVTELDELAVTSDKLAELNQEYDRLAHGEQVLRGAQQAMDICGGDHESNVQSQLQTAIHALQTAQQYAPELGDAVELLDQANIQIDEAVGSLRNTLDRIELDPQRLQQLDAELSAIHDMARKHRIEADALPDKHQQLSEELTQLENSSAALIELEQQLEKALADYQLFAGQLHDARQQAAATLGQAITSGINELGMPHGRAGIAVIRKEASKPSAHGDDKIEFQISANPGQPMESMAKVASGGELARVSLAVQVAAAEAEPVPCMIFDEVDTGIGGAVAEMVGGKLAELGQAAQVLCVTHLPQVAAQANQQLQVQKSSDGKSTETQIVPLTDDERVEEIARMLGGVNITDQTRAHAREMLGQ